MTESDGRRKHEHDCSYSPICRGGYLMARRRISAATFTSLDISSKAYGTGVVQLLASGYLRWLNFFGFTWDGQHRDSMNRPVLLHLSDAIMQSDGTSFYPSTVLRDETGESAPINSISIEGLDVKMTSYAATTGLFMGLFYFGKQFV